MKKTRQWKPQSYYCAVHIMLDFCRIDPPHSLLTSLDPSRFGAVRVPNSSFLAVIYLNPKIGRIIARNLLRIAPKAIILQ